MWKLGRVLWGLTVVVTLAAACSGADDDESEASGGAGGAGDGGSGRGGAASGGAGAGAGGRAGAAGAGGWADEGGQCIEHPRCGFWAASFMECPEGADDVSALCDFADVDAYESTCGGTYVEATDGVRLAWWAFDEQGGLIGAFAEGDVHDCDFWGEHCGPVGEGSSLCAEGGAGGQGGANH